jgi:hypothetical protein
VGKRSRSANDFGDKSIIVLWGAGRELPHFKRILAAALLLLLLLLQLQLRSLFERSEGTNCFMIIFY